MNVSHRVLQDMLDAKIQATAVMLGVEPFWVEVGSFIIPVVFCVIYFWIIYLSCQLSSKDSDK